PAPLATPPPSLHDALPIYSSRPARPRSKLIRCTRPPTSTASSTREVIRRGVDTATSTPQLSSKSHSFFGLFTRETVRGTPNSVLDRKSTRLNSSHVSISYA